MKRFIWILIPLFTACSDPEKTIPIYEVQLRDFNLVVPGAGELEAAEAEMISAPGRQPMTIAWLEQEYAQVKKGQLVAQFDGEQLSLDLRREELAMLLLDQDMRQKQVEKEQQQEDVSSEKQLVSKEFQFIDEFAVDDLRLYSRLEIIDKMQNRDFLDAKEGFLDWKESSIVEQNTSALGVINIRKQGHQTKFEQHQRSLKQLDVKAPYDGLLVYQKNWRGEKPSIGQTVWPGNSIAKIPNLNMMQAKVYVLDREAISLEPGQKATLTLEAFPEQQFVGSVKEVAGFSRTIARGDPTKYFEIVIELDDKANSKLKPGRKLSAQITVAANEQRLLVPMQAIHNKDGQNYVYKQQGSEFVMQTVSVGKKNLYFVEVIEGLEEGDNIALAPTGANS